jgi:hypothetical protein
MVFASITAMRSWRPLLILCTGLGACATPIETQISSSGAGITSPIRFSSEGRAATDEARKLVLGQLQSKGLVLDAAGEARLEVTLAARPSALALSADGKPLSPALTKKDSRRCKWQEYRLGVGLYRISDGAELYKASAAEHHCKEALNQVMPMLVDAALADLAAPRGSYIVKRVRRPLAAPN